MPVSLDTLSPRLRRLILSQPVHTLGGPVRFTAPPSKARRAVAALGHSSDRVAVAAV